MVLKTSIKSELNAKCHTFNNVKIMTNTCIIL